MVPFSDNLCANDDIDVSGRESADNSLRVGGSGECVAGGDCNARARKARAEFFLDPFDARPARDKRMLRSAFTAPFQTLHFKRAVMTDQSLAVAVFDHPRR